MNETLQIMGKVAGLGGLALGVFLVVFRDVIRKTIFPNLTREQGYKLLRLILLLVWSITALGLAAWVVVVLVIPVFHSVPQPEITPAPKVTSISKLVEDIEKIKVLLPFDYGLSDCLNKRQGQFNTDFEACIQQSKISQTNALNILDRSLASLKLFFQSDELEDIQKQIFSIRYAIYEMHNNQLALEHWRRMNCPTSINFISATGVEAKNIPTDKSGKPKCVLSVETFQSFLDQASKNNNPFSALVDRNIPMAKVKMLIVPGSKNSIDSYFVTTRPV